MAHKFTKVHFLADKLRKAEEIMEIPLWLKDARLELPWIGKTPSLIRFVAVFYLDSTIYGYFHYHY